MADADGFYDVSGSHGETDSALIYIPTGIFLFFCPLLVGTRLWSRMRKGGKIGADDYTVLASLFFSLLTAGLMFAACYHGYGRHGFDLTREDKMKALKYFVLTQATYKASINLTKSSILLLYMRIFGKVRWFKWVCINLTIIVAMYCTASLIVTIFQCTPVEKAWDKGMVGSCIDNGKFWYANGAFSIATDIIILLLPMPLVYALQLPKVQKAALILVFTLGIFVVITSCLRLTTLNHQAVTPDPTYDIVSTMWTVIEMNVAIMCACLPQIRPLLVRLFPKAMPASYSNGPLGRPPYNSGFTKGPKGSPCKSEGSGWNHIEGKDAIHLTKVRKGDTSSEEYILQDDNTIHKTVGFSVEFSKKPSRDTLNTLV
ncbi:hypothetical protein BKA67DRAFT_624235 [Truncatella angustata]|uniref:Rhodopsin domain-containing protein n=1 Tax=Truncatella angustata TaxID=152316 RepID=A0A9P8ZXH7_9PEZI|nr:uncharacterized protein BKA67DRAFT_624235 [Truncatella angustata]KAH6654872.1 hypothetical protein BKA67DRAFT_624235 [Truncatella angustata]